MNDDDPSKLNFTPKNRRVTVLSDGRTHICTIKKPQTNKFDRHILAGLHPLIVCTAPEISFFYSKRRLKKEKKKNIAANNDDR